MHDRAIGDFRIHPPLASKTGDPDLDDLPRFQEVAGHALIDGYGQGSNIPGVDRMLGCKDALAVPDLDLAQQRQAVQSLTQGRTADPKLTGQLALRRNTCALGKTRIGSWSCCATTSVSFGWVAFLRPSESSRLPDIATSA